MFLSIRTGDPLSSWAKNHTKSMTVQDSDFKIQDLHSGLSFRIQDSHFDPDHPFLSGF